MSLPRHIFHHSIGWLVLPLVVILALYVSIGRFFFPLLSDYRTDLLRLANDHSPLQVQTARLFGQWNRFDPFVKLEDITLSSRYQSGDLKPSIEVDSFSLELDSWSSLRYQFPVIRQASIEGVTLRLQQQADLSWQLKGWENTPDSGNDPAQASQQVREDVEPLARFLEFLMAQQHLKMEFVWLEFYDRFGREYRAFSQKLEVFEENGVQRIQGALQLDPGAAQKIELIMELSGDPFDQASLDIDLYLKADPQSLSSWLDKVAHLLPVSIVELEAGIELWTQWKAGQLDSVKGSVSARKVHFTRDNLPEIVVEDLFSSIFWVRDMPDKTQGILHSQAEKPVASPDSLHEVSDRGHPKVAVDKISPSPVAGPAAADGAAVISPKPIISQEPFVDKAKPVSDSEQTVESPPALTIENTSAPVISTSGDEAAESSVVSDVDPAPSKILTSTADISQESRSGAASSEITQDLHHEAQMDDLTRAPLSWHLTLDQLSFKLQQEAFNADQLRVVRKGEEQSLKVMLAQLDLAALSRVLLQFQQLPEDALDALQRLKPSGELNHLQVTFSAQQPFQLSTYLAGVSVEDYYGAPVLRNVDGFLQTGADEGYIRFTSDQFHMAFPLLYDQGWDFDRAQGRVDWQITDKVRVFGQGLELRRGESHVAGEFDVWVHQDGQRDLFYLNVGATDLEKTFGLTLIPGKVVNRDLVSWLKGAVRQGKVPEAGFIYDGSLYLDAENPVREMSTQLMLRVKEGELEFLPDWPAAEDLEAHIFVDGTQMDAALYSGRYLENGEIRGRVNLVDDQVGSRIQLNLTGDVVPEKGWAIFTETPLKTLVPDSLLDWQLSGPLLGVQTALDFPIDGRPGTGKVDVKVAGNRLMIPELDTPLDRIKGRVTYDLEKGLSASDATAVFLEGLAQFSIDTDFSQGQVQVNGQGHAPLGALNRWQPMPFSPWLSGELKYDFDLSLDSTSHLMLKSDLKGVAIALPEAYGKAQDEVSSLLMEMRFSEQENRFRVELGEQILAKGLWLTEDSARQTSEALKGIDPYAVNIWLGEWPDRQPEPEMITGRSDIVFRQKQLALAPWVEFAEKEQARYAVIDSVSASGSSALPTLHDSSVIEQKTDADRDTASEAVATNRFHLEAGQVTYGDVAFDDLILDAEHKANELSLRFASPQLQGEAHLTKQKVTVNLDTLFYEVTEAAETPSAPELLALPEMSWLPEHPEDQGRNRMLDELLASKWPEISLNINDFRYNKVIGENLKLRYNGQGLVRELVLQQLEQGSMKYSGVMRWHLPQGNNQPVRSDVALRLAGKDLAHAQQAFGVKPMLNSQKAELNARLNWRGFPHDFSAATLSGSASLSLDKGEFEQVSSAPALKLLSLFNFGELIRRLQLDFSDLAGQGLSYDSVRGQLTILNGQGHLSEPLRVDGSATKFRMSGGINFVDETLDQELIVTLPVAEALPLAAFLAGAPQLGGTIYIAQKILGNLFEKVTRARYDVKGAWDNPEIELKRVF